MAVVAAGAAAAAGAGAGTGTARRAQHSPIGPQRGNNLKEGSRRGKVEMQMGAGGAFSPGIMYVTLKNFCNFA